MTGITYNHSVMTAMKKYTARTGGRNDGHKQHKSDCIVGDRGYKSSGKKRSRTNAPNCARFYPRSELR